MRCFPAELLLADSELQKPKAKERLRCFDEITGRPIWTHAYDVAYEDWAFDPAQEIGPVATPIVDSGRIYSLERLGNLFCLDTATGAVVWQKNLEQHYQVAFAPGTPSRLIEGDLLILCIGGKPEACIVALHNDTGKEVWKALDEKVTLIPRFRSADATWPGPHPPAPTATSSPATAANSSAFPSLRCREEHRASYFHFTSALASTW